MVKNSAALMKQPGKVTWREDLKSNWLLYLIFLIPAAYFIIFHYIPIVGIFMAFQNYKPSKGLFGSKFVGLENFRELLEGEQFPLAMRNTACMSVINLLLGFAVPVILGLLISQVRSKRMSRTVQTVTYMPYFVSAVVCATLAQEFFRETGAITQLLCLFGFDQVNWLSVKSPAFWFINAFLNIWQNAGYGAIVYIAAIANISPDLYEAATVDGANRWKQLTHITIPGIIPILVMMFTMQIGLMFKTGFDKVLLIYMPSTYEYSDVLYTYTYRMSFGSTNSFGLSTASGLFQSIISTILLLVGNKLSRKVAGSSLF